MPIRPSAQPFGIGREAAETKAAVHPACRTTQNSKTPINLSPGPLPHASEAVLVLVPIICALPQPQCCQVIVLQVLLLDTAQQHSHLHLMLL
jgi:hypothetical protein